MSDPMDNDLEPRKPNPVEHLLDVIDHLVQEGRHVQMEIVESALIAKNYCDYLREKSLSKPHLHKFVESCAEAAAIEVIKSEEY